MTAPIKWKQKEWLNTFSILGATGVAYLTEEHLNNWIINNKNSFTNNIGTTGYAVGHPFILIPLTSLAYTSGYYFNNYRLQRAGLVALEGLILSGIATKGIKMMVHRQRPRTSNTNHNFDGPAFSLSEDNQSFPSGHSALAWATATAFASEYKENNAIVYGSYGLATFVSISRVLDNAHWASDTIVGSAIGYFIAKHTFKKYKFKETNNTISITPILSNDIGLLMKLNF